MEKLKNLCVICGHSLNEHFDEERWFRCHALGHDYFQCECRIIKDLKTPLEEYNYIKRKFEHIKELFFETPEDLIKSLFSSKEEECLYFIQNFLDKSPKILHNKLRIKDTRIPVNLLLELVNSQLSISQIIEEYPSLSKEVIEKMFEFKDLLKEYVKEEEKK